MYRNRKAIATAGKTKPTRGTRIEGRKDAAIIKIPFVYMNLIPDFI
jgi:hypothetical protein